MLLWRELVMLRLWGVVIVAILSRRGGSAIRLLVMGHRTRIELRRRVCSHGRGALHIVGHLRRHGGGAFGRRPHRLGEHGLRATLLLLGGSGWAKDVVVGGLALLRRGAALLLRVLSHCERQGLATNTSGGEQRAADCTSE